MAKKKAPKSYKAKSDKQHYAYITAEVDCGEVLFVYRLIGNEVEGTQLWDEDVSDWSDDDIINLARQALDVEKDDPVQIKVEYV